MKPAHSTIRAIAVMALTALLYCMAGVAFAQDAATLAPAGAQSVSAASNAATTLPTLTVAKIGDEEVSLPLQVLLAMTAITLLPAALLALTAFTRIMVALALLRQALGTGQTPSNQVLIGLGLFLTMLVMMPVLESSWAAGIAPYLDGSMDAQSAWTAASEPLRGFMLAQVRDSDLMTFAGLAGRSQPYASPQEVPFHVLAASFLTSELRTGFEIGFLLFVPFVIIDLVVASVLMSMGMMMLSPMLVSAPFKILLFVLADGWILVVGSLAGSFHAV